VAEENPSLDELPREVLERAELMAEHAFSGKKYVFELHSSDLLLQEILAFPVAKIILSFAGEPLLYRKFSEMAADSAFEFILRSKDRSRAAVELANDFSLKFDFSEKQGFFVSLPLNGFLSVKPRDDSLKLVNQLVVQGRVFLDLNGFCRFLREKVFEAVFGSLPVPVKGLPRQLELLGKRLKAASKKREQAFFREAFSGKVSPDAFPPCISQLYSTLASGQKLPHMANFSLAAFLNSIGMPKPQILALFKKSPNFKERIASYQLDRIVKQNYAPPSCEKMKEYGLCQNVDCRVKHPLGYYRRHSRPKKGVVK
jgi:DNA primase large subunit